VWQGREGKEQSYPRSVSAANFFFSFRIILPPFSFCLALCFWDSTAYVSRCQTLGNINSLQQSGLESLKGGEHCSFVSEGLRYHGSQDGLAVVAV
jgi:hypothetical protein